MNDTPDVDAFILMGGFGVVCRNWGYITQIRRRGLVPLLITPRSFSADVVAAQAMPDHIVHQLGAIAYVEGALNMENSFTADTVRVMREWEPEYAVKAVFAVGEVLVEQAGLIADRYGLPSPGLRATRVCRSKYLQRWYLSAWSPRSIVVPPAARASFDFRALPLPYVLKPSARHSSSGVTVVNTGDDLPVALAEYAPHETLLVEERVAGPEYSVEALVQSGRPLLVSVTEKTTTESCSDHFVEIRHSIPYIGPGAEDLRAATEQVLAALHFRDGIAHAEWRISTRSGQPVLMEIAARTPGDALLPLYRLVTGKEVEDSVVAICLGEPTRHPAPDRYARQVYLAHDTGVLDDVTVAMPGVRVSWPEDGGGMWPPMDRAGADEPATLRAVLVLQPRGSQLRPIRDNEDRAVTFVIDGPDPAALDRLEQQVCSAIQLRTESAVTTS